LTKLFKSISSALADRNKVEALKMNVKGEEFPQELLDFPYLRELYLEGPCKKFPTSPNWKHLKILSIKWPLFLGDLSDIFALPSLENLKIIETPLKQFLLPLGYAMAPLKSLTIKDCGLEKLPEEISMLNELNEMNLSGNKLTQIPASFEDLIHLKRLNLDHNSFTHFPDVVKKVPALSHLSIDSNNFSDDEKARIQREFHIWVN
jgi:Leucine-rich repeat (LRR) protein